MTDNFILFLLCLILIGTVYFSWKMLEMFIVSLIELWREIWR